MIEVLIALNSKGFISNEDDTPIYEGDEAHTAWRSEYLKGRRVVLGYKEASVTGYVKGSMATFTMSGYGSPVKGTFPITQNDLTNRSAIQGENFVVCGGYRTFVRLLPFADIITLAFVAKDSGREKILLPDFPLHRVKWFPVLNEHGVWCFRGLNASLVETEQGVSGDGAIQLPTNLFSQG